VDVVRLWNLVISLILCISVVCFQWPCSQKVYVVYRIFVAGGFIAWLIADIFKETHSFFKDHTYTYLVRMAPVLSVL